MSTQIPLVYRLVFTWIDPAFCMLGAFTHLFAQSETLLGYSANYSDPPRVEAVHLMDSMTGFFLMVGLIEAVLLRARSSDATVWRTVQAGGVLLDALMTVGALRALSTDGRMDTAVWRGDDWRLVAGNAGMGVLRLCCALGFGFGREGKAKRG